MRFPFICPVFDPNINTDISIHINCRNRNIVTIRKHIVPEEALAGAGVAVGVEKAAQGGVVKSALQVIEASLFNGGLPLKVI